ncbi:MAG: glycosyltransferase family 4 protein [Burkholderiaceae bacterium]
MRILLVSEDIPYPQMGGLAKHVLRLARALIDAGHEVDLLGGKKYPIEIIGEEGKFGGRFFAELDGHETQFKEGKLGMYVPMRRTWSARRFAKVIMRHAKNYDVIHYHGHVPNVARFIPEEINFVQTRHDQGSECLADVRFRNGRICTEKNPLHCAGCKTANPNIVQQKISVIAVNRYRSEVAQGFQKHKTIFVSEMLRKNFARTMGDQAYWGTVVHNFVNTDSIENAMRSARTHSDPKDMTVFMSGKLYPAKGIEAFLRAIAGKLPAHMRIRIAGDGPDGERLSNEFASDKIQFLGWCTPEQTLETAAASSVVVMPSLCEEAFGYATLEGLLLGKPTFALEHGATPELAMYASYPGQLRLHANMDSLVQDLITYVPGNTPSIGPCNLASVEHAVQKILDIYRRPLEQLSHA